jgi:urease accessory protein
MRRAIRVAPAGTWPVATSLAWVTLPFEERQRRRFRLIDDRGQAFLLDLDRAVLLSDGDGLVCEDGSVIGVRAAAEPVIDVAAIDACHLARLAWHLGNRHVPVQVLNEGRLRLLDDHVLLQMLERLGAGVERRKAPFAPEPGAYGAAHPEPDHDHGRHHS